MLDLALMLAVFAAAFAVGYALISRVPQVLHTPLMSMTNAISAVTILGALLLFSGQAGGMGKGLGAVALAAASFNLVGGFVITDRMLSLFRKKDSAGSGE
jgi:proton-translocating NAD(P)+ transhydrogenase subunit alpha